MAMLTFDEARARVVALARSVSAEVVPTSASGGRVLAEDVRAPGPLPADDASAMDGYALASGSLMGEGPWRLPAIGESRAGRAPEPLRPGCAMRILTGALMPAGADTVVMQEDVQRDGDVIVLARRPEAGDHVRRAGRDLAGGAVALARGTRLTAGALSLAQSLGRGGLRVARRPRVTVLCSGDELRLAGESLERGSIYESNSAALCVLAAQAGAVAEVSPIVRDELDGAAEAVRSALDGCDLLVTVGGASVGDHDVMKAALERAGVTLDFWKVAMKPGKPLAAGTRDGTVVLALPGNPAASLVTFGLFGMPLLRTMQGDAAPHPLRLRARLASDLRRKPGRLEFARARLENRDGELVALLHENQGSGAATSLAWSDSYALVPADATHLPAGTVLDVVRIGDF